MARSSGEGREEEEPSFMAGRNEIYFSHSGHCIEVSQNLKLQDVRVKLLYTPAAYLLRTSPRTLYPITDSCSSVFITVLCTTPGRWSQTSCLLAIEWIMKICYIYTMELYLSVNKGTSWGITNLLIKTFLNELKKIKIHLKYL